MKAELFFEIVNRFYAKDKIKIYLLFPFSLIAGLFEFLGLVLIFQFVLFLSNPNTRYCEKIIYFFKNNLNVDEFSNIALILGIAVASIYVLKNAYMLIFTRYNNEILQDLSIKITVKTLKNILFQDYLISKKTTKEKKINVISKIILVVWQYCYKFINLYINCAIALILLLFLFFKFALVALVAFLFISLLALIEYKLLKKNSTHQNKYFANFFNDFNSLLFKALSSIKEIKLNNKQKHYVDEIEKRYKNCAILNKKRSFYDTFHVFFTEISIMLAFVLILIVLFYTTNFDNQLLITTLSTICVIILRLTPVINRAQCCLYAINSNKSLVQELLDFDNQFDKNFDFSTTYEKMDLAVAFELKNIFFSYDDGVGLKNINLKINKGEFVGIIGKSGCYKTTLSLIIAGLIKPTKGEILIDNKILKNYQKWQNNIALLSQDYSILFDSIDEIDTKYLNKLELNEDLKIDELSYGQKQRLALSNILSANKDILILDEITSSCDVLVEEEINDILLSLKGKKTIIAIAHRLNILKHCDRIIYMDDGEIIDIDTFKALNDKYDEFRKIIQLSSFKI